MKEKRFSALLLVLTMTFSVFTAGFTVAGASALTNGATVKNISSEDNSELQLQDSYGDKISFATDPILLYEGKYGTVELMGFCEYTFEDNVTDSREMKPCVQVRYTAPTGMDVNMSMSGGSIDGMDCVGYKEYPDLETEYEMFSVWHSEWLVDDEGYEYPSEEPFDSIYQLYGWEGYFDFMVYTDDGDYTEESVPFSIKEATTIYFDSPIVLIDNNLGKLTVSKLYWSNGYPTLSCTFYNNTANDLFLNVEDAMIGTHESSCATSSFKRKMWVSSPAKSSTSFEMMAAYLEYIDYDYYYIMKNLVEDLEELYELSGTLYAYLEDAEDDILIGSFDLSNAVHTHTWGSWTTSKSATCTASGTQIRTCATCGERESKTISPLDHSYTNIVTSPTCTDRGYTTHTCTRCGDSYIDTYTSTIDHSWINGTIVDTQTEGEVTVTTYEYTCASCGTTTSNDVTTIDCPSNDFSDVDRDQWYHPFVDWAVTENVTAGMGNGTFGVNINCSRAQIVTFLWNRAGKPMAQKADNPFSDVSEDQWYYNAVLWAVEQGITAGVTPTTFDPNGVCTRAQAVTFLYNEQGRPNASGIPPFTDVQPGDWYYSPVLWAISNQITAGMGNGQFGSSGFCTRAQIVTFLYNQTK